MFVRTIRRLLHFDGRVDREVRSRPASDRLVEALAEAVAKHAVAGMHGTERALLGAQPADQPLQQRGRVDAIGQPTGGCVNARRGRFAIPLGLETVLGLFNGGIVR